MTAFLYSMTRFTGFFNSIVSGDEERSKQIPPDSPVQDT